MIPQQSSPIVETVHLDRESLRDAVRRRGLVVLHVGEHRANPEVLTVYLNGVSGQWAQRAALNLIESIPGVVAVAESVSTPTILLVRVAPRSSRPPRTTSDAPVHRTGGGAAG
jgi:hypothetical protein